MFRDKSGDRILSGSNNDKNLMEEALDETISPCPGRYEPRTEWPDCEYHTALLLKLGVLS